MSYAGMNGDVLPVHAVTGDHHKLACIADGGGDDKRAIISGAFVGSKLSIADSVVIGNFEHIVELLSRSDILVKKPFLGLFLDADNGNYLQLSLFYTIFVSPAESFSFSCRCFDNGGSNAHDFLSSW